MEGVWELDTGEENIGPNREKVAWE
jgi:hypothetical protein